MLLIIIGTLEENEPGKIFLLNVEELQKANHTTIFKLFDKPMNILWPDGFKHNNVLLFLTHAAPYMVKSAKSIKTLYSKMNHITCLALGLHRVAETVRNLNPKVDKIIANVKKLFNEAPTRVKIFKNMAQLLPLPTTPILTRWGTWIEAALCYCEHFELIQSIANSFNKDDAISIKTTQKYIERQNIQTQFMFLKSNFSFLPNAIPCLEKQGSILTSAISIVEDAKIKLTQVGGT